MDVDLAVEKLSVSGTILATLTLNSMAPFPHATSLSVSFLEKPDVWFSVRILRAVQMMEMPLIKTWIHAVVTDALASWIVDPGHLEMNLRARERPGPKFDSVTNSIPQGVLTVVLSQNGCAGKWKILNNNRNDFFFLNTFSQFCICLLRNGGQLFVKVSARIA